MDLLRLSALAKLGREYPRVHLESIAKERKWNTCLGREPLEALWADG